MTLEQQVCNLDLAKRLKELGAKQDILFAWFYNDGLSQWELDSYQTDWPKDEWPTQDIKQYSAFTVAELGEMLWSKASPDNIRIAYNHVFHVEGSIVITPEGLSQCMENPGIGAMMLIYLVENTFITL